jgi:membrane protein YqaA with SNARE-associated domain
MIWARHKYATYWLALVSFTESSCFLVPPDVMLAPMTLARPERAWFLAMLTTVTSVLGGLLGYFIGLFAFNMAEPLLISLGYMDAYIHAAEWFDKWGIWAIFLAGFTPIPFKIFTIAAGAANMALIPFLLGSFVGRGLRFFLVAGLMRWGGPELESKLHLWVDRLGWFTVLGLVIGYFIFV